MPDFGPSTSGVLPLQWLRKAVDEGIIQSSAGPIPVRSYQPASLDLRLGSTAYRLRCSFLPEDEKVEAKLPALTMGEVDLSEGAVLEQNRPYLIPLVEQLRLPRNVRAKANPRSSTGRLDVFTRVISDKSHVFDEIQPGYRGRLYLEVVSRSFTVFVREGLSLNQLRLMAGDIAVPDNEIREIHKRSPLLFQGGKKVPAKSVVVANGVFLSVDLVGDESRRIGYRAKKNSRLLDLQQEHYYEAEDFWLPVHSEKGNRLVLEPEEFYLLLSRESVRIPPSFAAEMTAYDPTSGELRTHYAGFFDPGFGHDESGVRVGTKAALEVRAHDVPFMIEEGQRVCRLAFVRMAEEPEELYGGEVGSTYYDQNLTLSRHFRLQTPSPWQLKLAAGRQYNPESKRV